MYRHSPSRNQRSKGFKLKHALQIFVLVAVCFWLIYQVKHSHYKRKEFDENDAKITQTVKRDNEILKFGRKDLNPQVKETSKENEKHDEDAEEETGGEEDDDKTETKEDEGKGGGDDELDENDQGKTYSELDHEEEFLDEEKAREEGDDKEIEEKDIEDIDSRTENNNSVDGHDHDGGTTNTHEAREEQYKADDASSAVTHDGQTISTENDSGSVENQVNIVENENKGNNTEERNTGQNTTDLAVHEGETSENGTSTVNEEKGSEVYNSTSQGSSSLNSIITSESNDQSKLSSDSNGLSLPNGTEIIISDPSHTQNVTEGASTEGSNFQTVTLEQADDSSKALDNSQFHPNSTTSIATENVEANPLDSSNSSTNLQFVASEHTVQSNVSADETKDGSESTIIEANTNTVQNGKADSNGGTDGTYESSDSTNTENADELQHDTTDSSIPLEDKEDHIDLDTLPDIRTEGSNSEEAAEE